MEVAERIDPLPAVSLLKQVLNNGPRTAHGNRRIRKTPR